jgi:hypothetical protein
MAPIRLAQPIRKSTWTNPHIVGGGRRPPEKDAVPMTVDLRRRNYVKELDFTTEELQVLGIPTVDYLPYAFFNLINPLLAIIFGLTGFGVEHQEPSAGPAKSPASAPTP